MAGRNRLADEVNRACENFLLSRGIPVDTYREMINNYARSGVKRRPNPRETKANRIAEELEREC